MNTSAVLAVPLFAAALVQPVYAQEQAGQSVPPREAEIPLRAYYDEMNREKDGVPFIGRTGAGEPFIGRTAGAIGKTAGGEVSAQALATLSRGAGDASMASSGRPEPLSGSQ